MRALFLLGSILILSNLDPLGCSGEDVMEMTQKRALEIVENSTSPIAEFNIAMQQLEPVKGDANFWLKIAADDHFSEVRRRRVVKHFWDQFVKPGMSLAEIVKLTGTNVNWISYEKVRKDSRDDIGGWLPETLLQGRSGFSIPILSKPGSDYNLVILVSFEDDLSLTDLLTVLRGELNSNSATNAIVAAYGTWDSHDQEKKYPGSKSYPWPW